MRRIANITESTDKIVRLMMYTDKGGTYLFGYTEVEDCGAEWDEWYETEEDALNSCKQEYGVLAKDWVEIPDPAPNCRHDRINEVPL